VVQYAVEHDCDGLTFLSGIPGTVGGAICGNAGAFGQEIGSAVLELELADRSGHRHTVHGDDMAFDYRRSPMQKTGNIVLSAVLRVHPTDTDQRPERERILSLRREKHPDWRHEPCAGSVFRNLAPPHPGARRQAAGWLLEQAGAKSMARGGARVYAKHANIVVKADETCRAQDVYDLVKDLRKAVFDRFDIELEPEIRFIGSFETVLKDDAHDA
jgi:UDP-N-acetylmuramate dehydrogenase